MSTTRKFDLVAKVGEYEQNGEKKARWQACGTVFENEKGQLSAKLNCVPVGPEWNGWLNFMPPSEYKNGSKTSAPVEKVKTKKVEEVEVVEEDNAEKKDSDEIPF